LINLEYTEKAVEKFDEDQLNLENRFYLGGLYGHLGRMYGISRSWLSAFNSGKAGAGILEDVIEEDPKFYDAYLLLGMLEYYGDRLSGFTGFLAGLFGMSRDRQNGLQSIQIAEQNGVIVKYQAEMLLAELYSRLESNDFDAVPYFEKFVKRFPNNKHMINWYCRVLLDIEMADKAAEIIENDFKGIIDDNVKGRYYHSIGNYPLAVKYFENVLADKNKFWGWYSRQAQFLYVIDNILLGNDHKIKNKIELLSERQKDFISIIIDDKETAGELFKLESMVCKYDEAEKIQLFINNLNYSETDSLVHGFYSFYKGVFYFKSNKLELAEKEFQVSKEFYPDLFGVRSFKYLLQIYKTVKTDLEKVELLLNEIDELDYEPLEYNARDLELIYDL
jgi:tetratricopeptide (TPR) repeat protein